MKSIYLYTFFENLNELNRTTIIYWMIWLIIFLILIVLGIILGFIYKGKRKVEKLKKDSNFNVRIYTFDYGKRIFYFFDMNNMSNNKNLNEEEFYNQFSRTDIYLIQDWLTKISRGESYPVHIQVNVKINAFNRVSSSILELTSINRQKHIIHFTSHLLPEIYTTNMRLIAHSKIGIPKRFVLKDIEVSQDFLAKMSKDSLSAVYYFKITKLNHDLSDKDDSDIIEVNKSIYLILGRFLSKTRKILKISDTDEVIIDCNCVSKAIAMSTVSTILTHLQQYLNHATENQYQIAIGVSDGHLYNKNVSLAIEQTGKMADAIAKGLSDEKILFYDESFFKKYQQTKQIKDEIRLVVRNSTFRNYFAPTLDINAGEESFYILTSLPYGTKISDFPTVINMCKDIKFAREQLFESLIEKTYKIVNASRKEIKIATMIPYQSLITFIKMIEKSNYSNLKWIIVIDEIDILTSMEDPTSTSKLFHDLNRRGYQIGIIIRNPSSGLRTRILKTISYFFIPPSFTSQSTDTNRSKTDLRNIQASYSVYKVPLVYYGLVDFDDVELGVHYGGNIFQCDELALPSSHIENIDKHKIVEIISDTKNLMPKNSINIIQESKKENLN